MALSQPWMSPVTAIRRPDRRLAWMLWIGVTVLGALIALLLQWEIRTLQAAGSLPAPDLVVYMIAVGTGLIISTGQWLVLRHYNVDAYWWIPASIAANVVAALFVVPLVMVVAIGAGILLVPTDVARFGILSAGASSLTVGTAQALVLRGGWGNLAWLWIPVTVVGAVLAAGVTNLLSPPLIDAIARHGFPVAGAVGLLGATAALLGSACQAPILMRFLR